MALGKGAHVLDMSSRLPAVHLLIARRYEADMNAAQFLDSRAGRTMRRGKDVGTADLVDAEESIQVGLQGREEGGKGIPPELALIHGQPTPHAAHQLCNRLAGQPQLLSPCQQLRNDAAHPRLQQ